MKKTLTILLILITCRVSAQTLQEWTQQKKTQLKYLVQQIAAFEVYIGYVKKGYSIAKTGLNAINNIKKGDFSLHNEYFNSLKKINPKIKSYWKVADITALQVKILQAYHKQKKVLPQSGRFNQDEINLCNNVFTSLLDGCTNIIDQLIAIETDGSLEMKDDERIKRIDLLHDEMMDKYVFAQHFTNENSSLGLQRLMDTGDINTSRALYNISN